MPAPDSASQSHSNTERRPWREPRQWLLWLTGVVGARYDGLHHFAVVEPGVLLRCGQPRTRDLEQIRQQHGLRTVVCARGGTRHPLRGRWFRKERAWCERHGVQLVHMPFSDKSRPPADIFVRFLEIIRNPVNRPVLVHCEQGFHRTGILAAAFRIGVQGWSVERALEEMARLGFEPREKRQSLRQALMDWASSSV